MSTQPESSVGGPEVSAPIFLSYSSRQTDLAIALRDALRCLGVPCWVATLDVEAGEQYTAEIVKTIRECPLFVVLLTVSASQSPNVMREFDRAIAYRRPILPLKIGEFPSNESMEYFLSHVQWKEFPDPPSEGDIRRMAELVQQRLAMPGPKHATYPSAVSRPRKIRPAVKLWILMLILLTLLPAGWWAVQVLHSAATPLTYPRTATEKNAVKEMLAYVQQELTILNQIYASQTRGLETAANCVADPQATPYEELVRRCNHEQQQVGEVLKLSQPLPDGLRNALQASPVNLGDLAGLWQVLRAESQDALRVLNFLPVLTGPQQQIDRSTRSKWLDLERRSLDARKHCAYYATCELLLPIDEAALEEFRLKMLPMLSAFSADLPWSRDAVDLKRRQDTCREEQKALAADMSSLVGNMNLAVQGMRSLKRQQEILATAKQQLASAKEETRRKFAPAPNDTAEMLWGKALRMLSVRLYDDAVQDFQAFLQKVHGSDADAEVYVPAAIRFVRSIGETGVDYGAIVVAFEPHKPPHSVLRVGDILIAVNGTPTPVEDRVIELMKASPKEVTATLLRADAAGKLVRQDVSWTKGGTGMMLRSLAERDRN